MEFVTTTGIKYSLGSTISDEDMSEGVTAIVTISDGSKIKIKVSSVEGEIEGNFNVQYGYFKTEALESLLINEDEIKEIIDQVMTVITKSLEQSVDLNRIPDTSKLNPAKFYHIQLSYVNGEVKYTKQVLNEELEFVAITSEDGSDDKFKVSFPEDLIPGSESLYVDGNLVPKSSYDLETGIYIDVIGVVEWIVCTYSVLLEQTEGKADHTEMPSLGVVELDSSEENIN